MTPFTADAFGVRLPAMFPRETVPALLLCLVAACGGEVTADRLPDASAPKVEPAAVVPSAPPPKVAPPAPVKSATPVDFTKAPEYSYKKANAEAKCKEEWTKRGELNAQMFAFCMNTEKDAFDKTTELLKKHGAQPWMQTLFPAIWADNTRAGITTYSQVGYVLGMQVDSFLDYEYEKKQPSLNASKMSACATQWASHVMRWQMTMHCYKEKLPCLPRVQSNRCDRSSWFSRCCWLPARRIRALVRSRPLAFARRVNR